MRSKNKKNQQIQQRDSEIVKLLPDSGNFHKFRMEIHFSDQNNLNIQTHAHTHTSGGIIDSNEWVSVRNIENRKQRGQAKEETANTKEPFLRVQ